VVLESADPDYFVPHVDLTKVAEYTAEAAKAGGPDDASLGMLWHKLSELTLPGPDAIRADARRFRQLVVSDAAKGRTAALFAQGLQTRGPLELNLGERLGAL
jgi:hypothetical protein